MKTTKINFFSKKDGKLVFLKAPMKPTPKEIPIAWIERLKWYTARVRKLQVHADLETVAAISALLGYLESLENLKK